MNKYMPQNFNDLFALILVFAIIVIWLLVGCGKIGMLPEINGALIVTWTLIVQYYFRKKKSGN
jgi:hypothetical protein